MSSRRGIKCGWLDRLPRVAGRAGAPHQLPRPMVRSFRRMRHAGVATGGPAPLAPGDLQRTDAGLLAAGRNQQFVVRPEDLPGEGAGRAVAVGRQGQRAPDLGDAGEAAVRVVAVQPHLRDMAAGPRVVGPGTERRAARGRGIGAGVEHGAAGVEDAAGAELAQRLPAGAGEKAGLELPGAHDAVGWRHQEPGMVLRQGRSGGDGAGRGQGEGEQGCGFHGDLLGLVARGHFLAPRP